MQGTMPGARRRGRPRTAWMDNMKTWTGLSVEESIRMTAINGESTSMGVTNPRIQGSRTANEQNRTVTPAAVKVTLRRTASTVTFPGNKIGMTTRIGRVTRTARKTTHGCGCLGTRVVSALDSGAVGPGFKSQLRRCWVTVLGKLLTPIVPLFTKQQNWKQPS